jgi:hypothetical protein
MSFLRWKKKNDTRKSLFIITNPVTVILCAMFFVELLLPVVAYLRSLFQ